MVKHLCIFHQYFMVRTAQKVPSGLLVAFMSITAFLFCAILAFVFFLVCNYLYLSKNHFSNKLYCTLDYSRFIKSFSVKQMLETGR